MSRKTIKNSLKTLLSATPGVNSVYTYLPRNQTGMQFPSIVVTIGNQAEKVYAMGNPGRRHIRYEVTLFIQTIDPNPNEQASQDSFDDFVDAIDTQLRSDKTLGGTVLYSAQDKIDTEVFGPEVAGQGVSILLRAMKTFDVVLEIIG